jgi:hypothetical protein
MEQTLEHLERVVVPARFHQHLGGDAEVTDGVVDALYPRIGFGEAQVCEGAELIQLDQLPEELERLRVLAGALKLGRDLVVGSQRVVGDPELLVELRELQNDVTITVRDLGDLALDDLSDLLVDSDGLECEPLRCVVLAYAVVRGDRVGVGLHLRLEVADLQQSPGVFRILLDDFLVFRDRLVVSFFLDETLGGQEHLLTVDRHFVLSLRRCVTR